MNFTTRKVLSDLLFELHSCRTWKDLTQFVIVRLHGLIQADRTSWAEFRGEGLIGYSEWSEGSGHFQERYAPIISRLIPSQSPIANTVGITTKWQGCLRGSDLVSQAKFEETELFNEGYKPTGARYQLALQINLSRFGFNAVSFWRWSRDFSEEERDFLSLLLPHLRLVYERLMRDQRIKEALGGGIVSSDESRLCFAFYKDMYLREADKSVLSMFEEMPDFDGGFVPTRIAEAIEESVRKEGSIQTLLSISGKDYRIQGDAPLYGGFRYVTLQPCESGMLVDDSLDSGVFLQLTRRQREVAIWIKQGKSNPEIARILGISPRTVAKHVENIFRVLGVESRYSFMANF